MQHAGRVPGTDMPDDHHLLMPRRNPEDIDLGAIKTDLEFIMERLSKLPTRQELALRPLYIIARSAGLIIGWIELFRLLPIGSAATTGSPGRRLGRMGSLTNSEDSVPLNHVAKHRLGSSLWLQFPDDCPPILRGKHPVSRKEVVENCFL
jgi:hypothetical protein